ncbi:transposase [Streptomyces sp. NBC_00237]|uniref:hypothetical protein n=1 Tax=Streptomyces sp. NBC_00237 TaxID=2975687 RepID=UPI00225A358E|nr:hypothetical protein [Streptomyces sp. NBC_00237]MCX5205825.1 transposase [Streptomyces sp. NBC_00237]
MHWLKHSPNAALFASLAASGEPITHQWLDQIPPSRHLRYVRHTLVHLGALPEWDEELERIPAWLDTVLADRPPGHVQLVRPYARWHLLRRARRRAARRSRARSSEPGSWWPWSSLPGWTTMALTLADRKGRPVALIGLVRVSTDQQKTRRQHDALGPICLKSGVEGAVNEFAHGRGMGRCRYRKQGMAHIPHNLTAIAVNIERLGGLLPNEEALAPRRPTAFQNYLDQRVVLLRVG